MIHDLYDEIKIEEIFCCEIDRYTRTIVSLIVQLTCILIRNCKLNTEKIKNRQE